MGRWFKNCRHCGGKLKIVPGEWRFDSRRVLNVLIVNGRVVKCVSCGATLPMVERHKELDRTIGEALLAKPGRLAGPELRFLRRHVRMRQADLCGYLGTDQGTVSKWETGEQPIALRTDLLVRYVVAVRDEKFRERLDRLAEQFKEIRDLPEVQIEVDYENGTYRHILKN